MDVTLALLESNVCLSDNPVFDVFDTSTDSPLDVEVLFTSLPIVSAEFWGSLNLLS